MTLKADVVNPEWENDWKEVVSKDFQFDSEYLIRIIIHKLNLMLTYFTKQAETGEKYEGGAPIDDIVDDLSYVCYLGDKILHFNTDSFVDDLWKTYGNPNWLTGQDNSPEFRLWERLNNEMVQDRDTLTKKFFNFIGENIHTWW